MQHYAYKYWCNQYLDQSWSYVPCSMTKMAGMAKSFCPSSSSMQKQDLQYLVVPEAEHMMPTLVLLGSKGIEREYFL
jgi:hypothetical protein